MTRRLVLLRHGRTAWNAENRAQGHADVDLDGLGHAQARAAAEHLAGLRPVALWSSDLARARQTAEHLGSACGLEVKCDDRLREYDVGERQGLTLEEFASRFPAEHRAWLRGDPTPGVPGAETTAEVATRMRSALGECLLSLERGETGVVVTHGAALKVGVTAVLGWPTDLASTLRVVANCGWVTVELEAGGRPRLAGYNQNLPHPVTG